MSSSAVPIPKRKQPIRDYHPYRHGGAAGSSSRNNNNNNNNHSHTDSLGAGSPTSNSIARSTSSSLSKSPASFASSTQFDDRYTESISPRRPSLLGSSLSRSEYTVINLGHGDGPPRLVTCVKSSQGFDWNQDLFLPSYATYENHDLEHKPDPVFDIVLTDEEAAAIFP